MNQVENKGFVFTGWHMFGAVALFFGIVISVNVYMAYRATTSWSGLVVTNTYIASQEFNEKVAEARELAATGVTGRLDISGSQVRFDITHPQDGPIAADELTLRFKRPVGDHQDFELTLTPSSKGVFVASHDIPSGTWIIEASATQNEKRILHQAERITVEGATK